ncbi:hypothetical protein CK203_040463 [Vitis vinifera]|uniref:Uncharacterized protein n=1 Tax=Vitis vinifera TaxID=29760 RepID=A0A438I834_VITVI|nr:hypothetical protein CK203_040463 [Vitis vinifera]
MNIYRESELSGDFEGEIRERRNQQEKYQAALADSKPISLYRQLYLLSQNRYFTHLMDSWSGGFLGFSVWREKRPSLTPQPRVER